MIQREFKIPNFRCHVSDEDGNLYDWITFCDSGEADLYQRLEAMGWQDVFEGNRPYSMAVSSQIAVLEQLGIGCPLK